MALYHREHSNATKLVAINHAAVSERSVSSEANFSEGRDVPRRKRSSETVPSGRAPWARGGERETHWKRMKQVFVK